MAYSYRWQYCDMDFLRHCLKKYSLLLKQLQLPPEKITLEQVYPLCYEDMGFFSENGSYRKRGEDFLKEAPQLLQDYETQHGKVLQERYSPEEWEWFRQAAD